MMRRGNNAIEETRSSSQSAPFVFGDETIAALEELGAVLAEIHKDLAVEGYVFRGDKIYKPPKS